MFKIRIALLKNLNVPVKKFLSSVRVHTYTHKKIQDLNSFPLCTEKYFCSTLKVSLRKSTSLIRKKNMKQSKVNNIYNYFKKHHNQLNITLPSSTYAKK